MDLDLNTKRAIINSIKNNTYKISDELYADCSVKDYNDFFEYDPDWPLMIIKFDGIEEEFGYNTMNGLTDKPYDKPSSEETAPNRYQTTAGNEKFYNIIDKTFENKYDEMLRDYERKYGEEMKRRLDDKNLWEIVDFYLKNR